MKCKNEALSTCVWVAILSGRQSKKASQDREGVGVLCKDPGPASNDDDDSIATALQDLIAHEAKS